MTYNPRHTLPMPCYTLIDTSRGCDPAVVVVNTALRAYEHRGLYPWHLFILITCELLADKGMPTAQEVKALEHLEGELSEHLLTNDNAILLARVTCRGMRELSFRVRDPKVADAHLKNLVSAANPLRQWEYRMERDPDWALAESELALIERTPGIN